jgi:hypothetical protein
VASRVGAGLPGLAQGLGPAPLAELQAAVLAASAGGHAERDDWSLAIGEEEPLEVHSGDVPVLRVPDTPGNRAGFGSVGTADDPAAWPSVRLYPLGSVFTRSLLAMPWGPAGTGKTASGQALLDAAMREHPRVFTKRQVWLLDRLWHGVRRLSALAGITHFLVRLKSDITLDRISEIYPGHSYLAEISGDGVTMTVRVIEYFVRVGGRKSPRCSAWSPTSWIGNSTPAPNSPHCINGGGTGPGPRCGRPRPRCTAPGPAPGRCSAPAAPS